MPPRNRRTASAGRRISSAKKDEHGSFKLVEETWFTIRENYDDLRQKTTSKKEREDLLADRDGARDAYYLALDKIFDEQDAFIKKTKSELNSANKEMKEQLESLEDIVAALAAVSSAVKLAAALAAMAVPA